LLEKLSFTWTKTEQEPSACPGREEDEKTVELLGWITENLTRLVGFSDGRAEEEKDCREIKWVDETEPDEDLKTEPEEGLKTVAAAFKLEYDGAECGREDLKPSCTDFELIVPKVEVVERDDASTDAFETKGFLTGGGIDDEASVREDWLLNGCFVARGMHDEARVREDWILAALFKEENIWFAAIN
jgi:hypothetical protein